MDLDDRKILTMNEKGKKNKAEQDIAVISVDLQYASRTLATKIIYFDPN